MPRHNYTAFEITGVRQQRITEVGQQNQSVTQKRSAYSPVDKNSNTMRAYAL